MPCLLPARTKRHSDSSLTLNRAEQSVSKRVLPALAPRDGPQWVPIDGGSGGSLQAIHYLTRGTLEESKL